MSDSDDKISTRDFARLCQLIHDRAGIHLSQEKRTMLEVRIKRRLKALGMHSYRRYCEYLFADRGLREEIVQLIDVVTTNKTDFFREPKHFDFLLERSLPEFEQGAMGRSFLVWSAGCSTGEEPYTLAMLLSEYAQMHPGFRFRVLATDISTAVLERAQLGIYTEEAVRPVPGVMQRKYFMHSRDRESPRLRVVPELRRLVEFRRLNFMDRDYGVTEKASAIFCRNVIIYFERFTQQAILKKLTDYLVPGGYLFVGHAETLHDMNLPLVPVAPSLYQRLGYAA
ncbi:MAG TPA: CheR family methyltransferase [Terracidiphilus sp.]|nr:CheR family methyltransferase [Terracidiphilus sp.]